MDISSTTSSSATINTADTNVSAQTQKSSKSDSSFKDEMNKVEQKEDTKKSSQTTDKSDEVAEDKVEADTKADSDNKSEKVSSSTQKNDNSGNHDIDLNQTLMLSGEINMSALQNTLANDTKISVLPDNVQTLIEANRQLASVTMIADTAQTPVKVDYSIVQMDSNDAKFFSDLVQNTDKTMQSVVADLQGGIEQQVQETTKNVKVSATLMNALSEAVKNKQSFRIDFDKDISVIIKVDKDGALSAKFIPGDKAVEEYLKQNMPLLRQRFDDQELSYKDLSYSRQQQRQNRRNNKENEHE